MLLHFFSVYPIANSIYLENYIFEIQPRPRAKLIRDHIKKETLVYLPFGGEGSTSKTSGLLISDFFRSRVMPFSTMLLLSFTWIAIARQEGPFDRLEGSPRWSGSSGKSPSRSRIASSTRRDGHSDTVTNTVVLATLRGEYTSRTSTN